MRITPSLSNQRIIIYGNFINAVTFLILENKRFFLLLILYVFTNLNENLYQKIQFKIAQYFKSNNIEYHWYLFVHFFNMWSEVYSFVITSYHLQDLRMKRKIKKIKFTAISSFNRDQEAEAFTKYKKFRVYLNWPRPNIKSVMIQMCYLN